ncbi:MAG: acyl-CoA thioesterase [Firmicutes bacterium]|nr:acyl-CoA thioesterase [Bacillota bacterium]MCL5012797.1 acyl-CoA thioesterase [Bacillota bacterium]
MMVTWQTDVRWAECDAAGIIYHARVFDWFSEARICWLENHDLDYYKILRPRAIELLVRHAEAQFFHAIHPGDRMTVHIDLAEISPTRTKFSYHVFKDDGDARPETCRGITEHIFVKEGHAIRLDRHQPELFTRFQTAWSQSQ